MYRQSVRFFTAAALGFVSLWATAPSRAEERESKLPPLPAPLTSFGAAIAGDELYVYGGHLGSPHEYSAEKQSKQLLRLNLAKPAAWEVAGEGPRRTGLAMVAHEGKLYRVGGWEAKNAQGVKAELHSNGDFARFDPKSGQWQDLTPLPEGRSSHDAAVLGNKLYVVGGWELAGSGDGKWHETALVCDLASDSPRWQEIARPGFLRRAAAVAAFGGKIYVIGGMDESGVTTDTNVYDSQTNQWSKGPALPGESADGFGTSAFGTASGLYATTAPGTLYRLAKDGGSWEKAAQLKHPRFFHRLLAAADGSLIAVGGTSRGQGKVSQVEAIVPSQPRATP